MRGEGTEGTIDLDDDDEMSDLFGVDGLDMAGDGVHALSERSGKNQADSDTEADSETELDADSEMEEDDDLLEPDLGGRMSRHMTSSYLADEAELEAYIDADFEAEDEDELEIAMLQELGLEIGDDSSLSMLAVDVGGEVNDTDSCDDDVAA